MIADLFAEVPVFALVVYEWQRLGVVDIAVDSQNLFIGVDGYDLADEHVMGTQLNHILESAFYIHRALFYHGR